MVKHKTKRAAILLTMFALIATLITMLFTGMRANADGGLVKTSYSDNFIESTYNDRSLIKKTGIAGQYALIADFDNCLTDSEESALLEILEKTAKKTHTNVGMVITRDLEGKSDKKFTDDFSDEVFGAYTKSIMLMFLNSYNVPQYSSCQDWISTDGDAVQKFQGKTTRMFDRIYDKLGEPQGNKYAYNESTRTYGGYDYASAINEYAKCVKRYGGSGFSAVLVIFGDFIIKHPTGFLMIVVVSILISLAIVHGKVKGYKKKAPISASNYIDRRCTNVTRQVDQFVREYTTSHTHSSSSGGGHHGGGGGGGHHGGGGGHHR